MDKESTKYQDLLKGLIKDVMGQKQLDANKEKQDAADEKWTQLLELNKALADKVEALEKMPAKKVNLVAPGETEAKSYIYKGYDMREQGISLEIADNDRKERHAKFLIDCINKATLNETTAAQGGNLVPTEYEVDLLAFARLSSIALRECRMMPMGRDNLQIPAEDGAVTVDWATSETDPNNQSEPTVSLITLSTERMGAYSQCTNDLLEDSAFDITSWLTDLFAEAIGQELDNQVFNGSTFQALLGNCGYTVTLAGAYTTVDYEDFSNVISQLSSNKLGNAKWYMNKAVRHYVRTMKDGSNRLIFALPGGNVPGTLYEYPIIDVEAMPVSGANTVPYIVFGDMKKYLLGKRRGMTLKVNPYILMKENQTQFVISSRWDGQIALANAFVEIAPGA